MKVRVEIDKQGYSEEGYLINTHIGPNSGRPFGVVLTDLGTLKHEELVFIKPIKEQ